MRYEDLNDIHAPRSWQARALAAQTGERPRRRAALRPAAILAVVLCLCAGTALGVGIYQHETMNPKLVADYDAMRADVEANGYDSYSYGGPNGAVGIPRDEMVAGRLEKSDHWADPAWIGGSVVLEQDVTWSSMDLISDEGSVKERVVFDGGQEHRRTEACALSPLLLQARQTGPAAWDLSWVAERYEAVPYANTYYVITEGADDYLGSYFGTLWLSGETGYFTLDYQATTCHVPWAQDYILDGYYEWVEDYTTADGLPCVLTANGDQIWVSSVSPHFTLDLYAVAMDRNAIKDVLDHLGLTFATELDGCRGR